MKENTYFLPMKPVEKVWGWGYLLMQLLLIPSLLTGLNELLPKPLGEDALNFVFFSLNFVVILLIFHRFLGYSFLHALVHPIAVLFWTALALAGYLGTQYILEELLKRFLPAFSNPNNTAIAQLTHQNWTLMAIGTVVLVPVVEECFYRGLMFRGLFYRSAWAAYLLSMLMFAAIHVVGYVGTAAWTTLAIAFFQYLPAGFFLAWSYDRSQTIAAPILIHALVNAKAIWLLPR